MAICCQRSCGSLIIHLEAVICRHSIQQLHMHVHLYYTHYISVICVHGYHCFHCRMERWEKRCGPWLSAETCIRIVSNSTLTITHHLSNNVLVEQYIGTADRLCMQVKVYKAIKGALHRGKQGSTCCPSEKRSSLEGLGSCLTTETTYKCSPPLSSCCIK